MTGIGTLFESILMLGVVILGLAYIVHPSAVMKVAKRLGTVAVAVFAINQALSYLWSNGIVKLLLISVIIFVAAKVMAGRGKQ